MHKHSFTFFALILLSILLTGCASAVAPRFEISDPQFEKTTCPVELPDGVIEGTDITCGYVTAPAFHNEKEQGTVRLTVALIHSTNETPEPDPVIMGMGGPGGSALDSILPLVLGENGKGLLAQRDVIVFEQRGVKYNEPHLTCPELIDVKLDHIGEEEPEDEELAAVTACRERLIAEGAQLNSFNNIENAADIPFIIDVLGYEGQFNYYGLSYGTLLGQHLIRDHSERLRSVILDGVAPNDLHAISEHAVMADRMFKYLFEKCAADAECSEEYPNVENQFLETADKLNENPAILTIAGPDGTEHQVPFDGDTFVYSMVLVAYEPGTYAYVPMFIDQIASGNFEIPEILGYHYYFGEESLAPGMRDAIRCSVDWSISEEVSYSDLYPQVASSMGGDGGQSERCEIWNVATLDKYTTEPVISDIPTLFISGEFDPVTPRNYADRVAANFRNSYSYTIPGGGHGNFLNVACADEITLAFLENPVQEPNTNCIDDISIKFGPPSLFTYALTIAKANLSIVILVVVILVALILGIVWLIRRRKDKKLA